MSPDNQLERTSAVITLNGESRDVPSPCTVSSLVAHLGLEADRVAVELDRRIVRRADWQATSVPAGASVEVVQFVGGG